MKVGESVFVVITLNSCASILREKKRYTVIWCLPFIFQRNLRLLQTENLLHVFTSAKFGTKIFEFLPVF